MEGTVAAPPQRVCPKCARISWATGPRCPYCRARFRRQSAQVIGWAIALAVVVTLAGVALMLYIAARELRDELDDRSAQIERHFDAQVNQIRQDIHNQIGALPTVTPFPSVTPAPSPTSTPSPTAAPTKTPRPTRTPAATSTPTLMP